VDLKNKKIAVLMGGPSREREVSLRSGNNIFNSLIAQNMNAIKIIVDDEESLKNKLVAEKVEIAFIALHGAYGEDGQVQTLLESMGISYTGSKPEACRVTIDKLQTKDVLVEAELPTPVYQKVVSGQEITLKVPLVIKPLAEGSSFGVSIVKDQDQLAEKIKETLKEFSEIFVEQYIKGQEVTVGIIGQNEDIKVLPVLELKAENEFYDFDAKYTPGKTSFILPAQLAPAVYGNVQTIALKAHQALGCVGLSRVDFIVDEKGIPWITEVNAIPGMTDQSDLPAEAKDAGISFDELVLIILKSAVK
jgi:D-alanine-D-alanine ligase